MYVVAAQNLYILKGFNYETEISYLHFKSPMLLRSLIGASLIGHILGEENFLLICEDLNLKNQITKILFNFKNKYLLDDLGKMFFYLKLLEVLFLIV